MAPRKVFPPPRKVVAGHNKHAVRIPLFKKRHGPVGVLRRGQGVTQLPHVFSCRVPSAEMEAHERGGGVVFLPEMSHKLFTLVAYGVGESQGFSNVSLMFFKVPVRRKVLHYLEVIPGVQACQPLIVPARGSLHGCSGAGAPQSQLSEVRLWHEEGLQDSGQVFAAQEYRRPVQGQSQTHSRRVLEQFVSKAPPECMAQKLFGGVHFQADIRR